MSCLRILSLTLVSLMLFNNLSYAEESIETSKCINAIKHEHYDIAFQQCEHEADNGDALAAEMLGYMYLKGKGTSRDWNTSRKFLEQSVDLGNNMAYRYLGIIYWNGLGVERNVEKARELFNECVTYDVSQDISCTLQFAKVLSYNTNSTANKNEALDMYKKLFDNGYYEASVYYARVAHMLKKESEAYRYAEFFMLWVKRYGDLSLLRKNYLEAERIRDSASVNLSSNELNEGFNWVRSLLNDINLAHSSQSKSKGIVSSTKIYDDE